MTLVTRREPVSRGKAQKNQARAEGAEPAETFSSPGFSAIWARLGRAWLARRRPWPAFKDTLELRTQTLRNQIALVFSIPVCPSPREARSGQPGFFSAASAISARDRSCRPALGKSVCDPLLDEAEQVMKPLLN